MGTGNALFSLGKCDFGTLRMRFDHWATGNGFDLLSVTLPTSTCKPLRYAGSVCLCYGKEKILSI